MGLCETILEWKLIESSFGRAIKYPEQCSSCESLAECAMVVRDAWVRDQWSEGLNEGGIQCH